MLGMKMPPARAVVLGIAGASSKCRFGFKDRPCNALGLLSEARLRLLMLGVKMPPPRAVLLGIAGASSNSRV